MRRLVGLMFLAILVLLPTTVSLAQSADGSTAEIKPLGLLDATATLSPRYNIPYMHSGAGDALTRAATVVSITNLSGTRCDVQVQWFRGFLRTPVCTTTFAGLENNLTADFCSRSLPDAITVCNSTCDPELVMDEGRALVLSAEGPCENLSIGARVYYTEGSNDETVMAISDSKVTRRRNLGD